MGHPLHGDLQIQDLDGRPYYEALLYTWSDETGDASLNRRMYIGPAWDVMPITRSCSRALRRLRLDQLARPLWIDAICINQLNNAEKSHQIALMRKIYVNCIRCIVDLGEPTKDSHLAFDRLNGTVTRDEYSLSLPTTSDQHAALAALLRRPYFRRIWIIQEITSSPQVQVVCGSCSADLRLLRESDSMLPPWMNILSTQIGLSKLESKYKGPTGLMNFLRDTRDSEASDPRDKIFALLGLTKGLNGKDSIVADYDLTYSQVCTGLAAYYLRYQLSSHLICLRGTRLPSLPSWVPNWGDLEQDDWDDYHQFDYSNTETSHFGVAEEPRKWTRSGKSKPMVRKPQWQQVLSAIGPLQLYDRLGIVRLQVSHTPFSEPELPKTSEYTSKVHAATGALIQEVAILLNYGDSLCHGTPMGAYRMPIFQYGHDDYLHLIMSSSTPVEEGKDSVAVIRNQHNFFHIRKESDGMYRIMGHAMLVFSKGIPGSSLPHIQLSPANFIWGGPLYTASMYGDHISRWCESTLGTRELWDLFIDPFGDKGMTLIPAKHQQPNFGHSHMFFYRNLNLEEVHAQYLRLAETNGGLYNILCQWVQNEEIIEHDDGPVALLIQCILHWGQQQTWKRLNKPIQVNVPLSIIKTHMNAWVNANIIRQRWLAVESIVANRRPSSSRSPAPTGANQNFRQDSRLCIDMTLGELLALWEELTDNLSCRLNAIADIGGFSPALFEIESPLTEVDGESFLDQAFQKVTHSLEEFYKLGKRRHKAPNLTDVELPRPTTSVPGFASLSVDGDLNPFEQASPKSSPRCSTSGESSCIACIDLQDKQSAVDWQAHWKIPKSRRALKGALESLHIQHFGDRRRWAIDTEGSLERLCLEVGILTNIAARSLKMKTVAII